METIPVKYQSTHPPKRNQLNPSMNSNLETYIAQETESLASLRETLKMMWASRDTLTLESYRTSREKIIQDFTRIKQEMIDFSKSVPFSSMWSDDTKKWNDLMTEMNDISTLFHETLPKPESLRTPAPYTITKSTSRAWLSNIDLGAKELGSLEVERYFGHDPKDDIDYFIVKIGSESYILQIFNTPSFDGSMSNPRIMKIENGLNDRKILSHIVLGTFYDIRIREKSRFNSDVFLRNADIQSMKISDQLSAIKTYAEKLPAWDTE